MKKNFKLEGLDCANCDAKMEKQINELPMVTAASVGATVGGEMGAASGAFPPQPLKSRHRKSTAKYFCIASSPPVS